MHIHVYTDNPWQYLLLLMFLLYLSSHYLMVTIYMKLKNSSPMGRISIYTFCYLKSDISTMFSSLTENHSSVGSNQLQTLEGSNFEETPKEVTNCSFFR